MPHEGIAHGFGSLPDDATLEEVIAFFQSGEVKKISTWIELLGRFDPVVQFKILEDQLNRGVLTLPVVSEIGGSLNLDVTYPRALVTQQAEAQRQEEAPARLRGEAATRAQALRERATQAVPPTTPASEAYFKFIEGLETPAMRDFFKVRENIPPEFAARIFGGRQEDTGLQSALAALSARKDTRARARAGLRDVTPEAPALAPFGAGQGFVGGIESVRARQAAQERVTRTRGGVRSAADRVRALRKAKSPFQQELEQFPFAQRFRQLTPGQRGSRGVAMPQITRFLGF